jgi:hypothetical protein
MIKSFQTFIIYLVWLCAVQAAPQFPSTSLQEYRLPAEWIIDYLPIQLASQRPWMGLVGVHHNWKYRFFYMGIGMYGAVRGDNGGFFSLGLNAGGRIDLGKGFFGDVGLHMGGGGARSLDGGGGLMIVPHGGIGYQFPRASLLLNYSYVTFPSGGQIRSSQVGIQVMIPTHFSVIQPTSSSQTRSCQSRHPFEQSSLFIMPILQAYLRKNQNLLGGQTTQKRSGLIGFEGGIYWTNTLFGSLGATAVGAGSMNGYMAVMGGLGVEIPLYERLFGILKGSVGCGGGGEADTGGGLLVQADSGLGVRLSPQNSLRILAGYLVAPCGHLKTPVLTTGFHHRFRWVSGDKARNEAGAHSTSVSVQKWSLSVSDQILWNPKRVDSRTGSIHFLNIRLDQFLTPYWAILYQGAFAHTGRRTAGLAMGALGAGIRYPLQSQLTALGSVSFGAIGGGGLNVGGGALVHGEVGCAYKLFRDWGVQVSMGRLVGLQKKFQCTTLSLGVCWQFHKVESFSKGR